VRVVTPAQLKAIAVAVDGIREKCGDDLAARVQRAIDGKLEAAVVRYRKAIDWRELDEDEHQPWEIQRHAVAGELEHNAAIFDLRTAAAVIEGLTPPCARCRLSGWIGDGVPCPDCDGNPQEPIEPAHHPDQVINCRCVLVEIPADPLEAFDPGL